MIVVTDVLSVRTEQEGFHLILLPEVPGIVYQISTEKHVLITTCISMHSEPISTIAETAVLSVRIARVLTEVPGVVYQISTEKQLCDVVYIKKVTMAYYLY